jgi:hypothetical protein
MAAMSNHVPGCAGDDYCEGNCVCDGISRAGVLMRADRDMCDCDWRYLYHDLDCPGTPDFESTARHLDFSPFHPAPPMNLRIRNTWYCVIHGSLGDINGPVHYETCPRTLDEKILSEAFKLDPYLRNAPRIADGPTWRELA